MIAAGLAAGLRLSAQTVATVPDQPDTTNEPPLALSPFVIDASEDRGYQANLTLAGTRVRSDLKDLASAITVVTQQFLQDTGSKNIADLLVYTPSTEVTGLRGNFSGVAGNTTFKEDTINTGTRVRGLDAADNTRDFYLTDIPWDDFDVGRIDVQRGPNSILFGTGSPAGIINASPNDASLKNAYSVENRVDQYGSLRDSVNFNQVSANGQIALRFAALQDHERFEQSSADNNSRRYFGALRYEPHLVGPDNHTSLRIKFERGQVRSDNPRDLPPTDDITPWFKTGTDAYGNLGDAKLVLNQFSLTNPNASGVPEPGVFIGNLGLAAFSSGEWSQPGAGGILNYYEAAPPNSGPPGGAPIKSIVAGINTAKGIPDAHGNTVAGAGYFVPYGIPPTSVYSGFISTRTVPGSYPANPVPGGIYYADTVLTDPSIYNFYQHLLDGPNKFEWQNWKAFNVALDQSFFGDRLAIQVAFDRQSYDVGSLAGMTNAISIDVNATYADGAPNPNVGRPYTGSSGTGASDTATVRDTFRITPTFELRATDLLGNTKLARILGRHNFTGLYETNTVVQNSVNRSEYATTPQYVIDTSPPDSKIGVAGPGFAWIAYLGPNLSGASSAHGANLAGVTTFVTPPPQQSVLNFNSSWNRSTDPASPNYVNPSAPYTYTDQSGVVQNSEQSQNPANYVGWSPQPVTWRFANKPADYPDLVLGAARTRFRDISQGITWQGHLLDGDLVPIFGWRKDVITGYQTDAPHDAITGVTNLTYPDNASSRSDSRGESKSWGGVYHLPKSLLARLPGDLTISLLYDRSDNFKADAQRLSLAGDHLPNAEGQTMEFGVVVTALNDKVSLKVNRFKTRLDHATLGAAVGGSIGGLGDNSYYVADSLLWGYAWVTSLQDGLRGQTPGTNNWDYAIQDGFVRGTPAGDAAADNYDRNGGISPAGVNFVGEQAIIDAWLGKTTSTSQGHTIKITPLPILQFPNFFPGYNLANNIDSRIGARTGNLRDSFANGYDDANGPVTGFAGELGDHQTTIDNLSTGTEIEVSVQPSKNWSLTLNYSKVKATREHIDPDSQAFMGAMTAFLNGPGGQVRDLYFGNTVGYGWNWVIVGPYTVLLNQLGHEAPEVSPWRLNIVSTYRCDRGPLKGAFFGGALRAEAGRIIGYKYNPNFVNAPAADPNYAVNLITTIPPSQLGGLDINQPFRGSNDQHVDAWIGYTRKVAKKITWRIQLNLRSVGERDHLVAARINPDGSLALARIEEGMGWQLTNAFDF